MPPRCSAGGGGIIFIINLQVFLSVLNTSVSFKEALTLIDLMETEDGKK